MIRFFAAHPTAANLLMLLLLVLGVLSVGNLRRETFPDFASDKLSITVVYPGASSGEIEDAVLQPVEDAVQGVGGVAEMVAVAREGVGQVTVEMVEGGDFPSFLAEIRTEVEAIDTFPSETEDPVIRELGTTQPVVSLAVAGDMAPAELKAWCERIEDRLLQLEEVSLVRLAGFSDHQLRIELDEHKLRAHGLSPADVAEIVGSQSLDLPVGSIETRDRDVLVRVAEQRRDPAALEDLIIVAGRDGGELRLGQVARVVDTFELDEEKITFDGRRAGLLQIEKTENQDALSVYDAVNDFVQRERAGLPPALSLHLTNDITSITRDRLNLLVKNGWQGLLLVFFSLWLFFNLRLSFWVTMGLPVSFLGAFFFLPMLGMTINMITMVGLLLALGLLMDDAIVLAENIATNLARGKSALQATIDGVDEVKMGVFSSFITTVAIFGPITAMEGDIGKVLKVMPVVLILVLLVSLVEAFLILPNHLAHALAHVDPQKIGPMRRRFENGLEFLRERVLGATVDLALRFRYLTVGLAVMALLLSMSMLAGGFLKFKAFPDLDGNVVVARLLMSPGTPLARTEEVVARLTGALARVDRQLTPQQPDGQRLVRHIMVQHNLNVDAGESGAHVATVSVDLLDAEKRNGTIDQITNLWRRELGSLTDVVSLTLSEPSLGPAGRAIEIRLEGEHLGELAAAADELRGFLADFDGVLDLSDDLRPGKPEILLRLREGAAGLGVTARSLAGQLRTAYQGSEAGQVQVGGESYEVDVRLTRENQDSLADLDDFHVTLPGGRQAPLSAVARLEEDRGFSLITRVDGRRTVTVTGDVDSARLNTRELMAAVTAEFQPRLARDHPHMKMTLEGEAAESATTGRSLGGGFAVGLIGVFLLLSFQFRGYIEPLMVMVAIPMALIGVIWGHILFGYPMTMPSMVGFVSLAGVVVNDSILLVSFIKSRRREGLEIPAAAARASRERFRAVLLTSLTTIAGLLPLLLERSLQAQILIPLAISLVFGLLASTLLVLLVIPCLYSILGDWNKTGSIHS